MTIRRTLLISYLTISLLSAVAISGMIAVHMRSVLRSEIERKLMARAATIMLQIDTTLFERMKNLASWRRLAVMQDVRMRDIDKRLSNFLGELYDGYGGVYQRLFVVNNAHEVIASSHPQEIGVRMKPRSSWLAANLGRDRIMLAPIDFTRQELRFSIDLADDFEVGRLGWLFAGYNWNEIHRLLGSPLPTGDRRSLTHSVLLDSDGRVIAASPDWNGRALVSQTIASNWLQVKGSGSTGALTARAPFWNGERVLIGYARSNGYRTFGGFGWRVLSLQPARLAFAPVSRLWWSFALFLAFTSLLGILVSLWISARIAKPIVRLTEFTRAFAEGKAQVPPGIAVDNEVGELRTAFAQMIEALERSRQDLVRAAKLAVIGEMAAGMAHEVRTPLGILRSSAEMLKRDDGLTDLGRELADFIISEADRLDELVSALLDSARPRQPKFKRYDFHRIVEHAIDLLRPKAVSGGVTLIDRLDALDSVVSVDRDQMIQVLLNLIMNAIQHTPDGGRVTVATVSLDRWFEVSVCDTGTGIAFDDRNKIFEPFVTGRDGGIGLGLTVVEQIVLVHGGRIDAGDNAVGGACFRVFVPLQENRRGG